MIPAVEVTEYMLFNLPLSMLPKSPPDVSRVQCCRLVRDCLLIKSKELITNESLQDEWFECLKITSANLNSCSDEFKDCQHQLVNIVSSLLQCQVSMILSSAKKTSQQVSPVAASTSPVKGEKAPDELFSFVSELLGFASPTATPSKAMDTRSTSEESSLSEVAGIHSDVDLLLKSWVVVSEQYPDITNLMQNDNLQLLSDLKHLFRDKQGIDD